MAEPLRLLAELGRDASILFFGEIQVVEQGYVITLDDEDAVSHRDETIHIVPAWRWMLNDCR